MSSGTFEKRFTDWAAAEADAFKALGDQGTRICDFARLAAQAEDRYVALWASPNSAPSRVEGEMKSTSTPPTD